MLSIVTILIGRLSMKGGQKSFWLWGETSKQTSGFSDAWKTLLLHLSTHLHG